MCIIQFVENKDPNIPLDGRRHWEYTSSPSSSSSHHVLPIIYFLTVTISCPAKRSFFPPFTVTQGASRRKQWKRYFTGLGLLITSYLQTHHLLAQSYMAVILEPVTNPSINMSILSKMCAIFSNRVMRLVLRLMCYIWMDKLH